MDISMVCPACRGTGKMMTSETDEDGTVLPTVIEVNCSTCSGVGTVITSAADSADVVDKLNDIKQKVDETKEVCDAIWKKINA
jgi:DnaJ-class molecular chaperone